MKKLQLVDDTNTKYFKPVEYYATDDLAQQISQKYR